MEENICHIVILSVFIILSPLIFIAGLVTILFVPYFAEDNHIEENALNPQLLAESAMQQSMKLVDKLYQDLLELDGSNEAIEQFIIQKMKKLQLQTYEQKFRNGKNIIGKMHTKRSNGYECNLFTFEYNPKNKLKNIAFMLGFIKILQGQSKSYLQITPLIDINYLSRDIIFIALQSDQASYGQGIRVFLDEYINPDSISMIQRCGVIRQSISLDLEDDFNQVALKPVGLDGRVPDRDFFLNINDLMRKANIHYTFTNRQPYFDYQELQKQGDKYIKQFWKQFKLEQFYKLPKRIFKFSIFFKMLQESILGNIHNPHSYLFQKGVQSITIQGYKSSEPANEDLWIQIGRVIEGANRAYMALDEHLHAGSTLWIPIGKLSVTVKSYVYPIAGLCLGMILKVAYMLIKHSKFENVEVGQREFKRVFHKYLMIYMVGLISLLIPQTIEKVNSCVVDYHYNSLKALNYVRSQGISNQFLNV